MVKLGLYLTATLENLSRLEPAVCIAKGGGKGKKGKSKGAAVGEDGSNDWPLTFTVKCSSCRAMHPNPVTFHAGAKVPLPGSGGRGDADFVYACRDCAHSNSIAVVMRPEQDDAADSDGAVESTADSKSADYGWPPHSYISHLSADDSDSEDEATTARKGPGNGERQLITVLETRGCEVVDFLAGQSGLWRAVGLPKGKKQGTQFDKIDLGEGEWFEYDEARACEVSIQDVSFDVARAK